MSSRGRYTDKDEIVDAIENEFMDGESISDDFEARLLKMTTADLFMLQILFSKAFKAGEKKERESTKNKIWTKTTNKRSDSFPLPRACSRKCSTTCAGALTKGTIMHLTLSPDQTPTNLQKLEQRLSSVITELALGPDNYSMGTGMGGNPEQFLLLLAATHKLSTDEGIRIEQTYGCPIVYWSEKVLLQDTTTIRQRLNGLDFAAVRQAILKESGVEQAPSYMAMKLGLEGFVEALATEPRYIDKVRHLVDGRAKTIDESLPLLQFAILSMVSMKVRDATQQEGWNTDTSPLMIVFTNLADEVGTEVLLQATRLYLGLELIVRHGLDEYPKLDKRLLSVARALHTSDEELNAELRADPHALNQDGSVSPVN